jgi:hypothetical protein
VDDCGISWSLSPTLGCRDLPIGAADRHTTKAPPGGGHPPDLVTLLRRSMLPTGVGPVRDGAEVHRVRPGRNVISRLSQALDMGSLRMSVSQGKRLNPRGNSESTTDKSLLPHFPSA